ncbi:hypothetical protein ACGFIY_10155 [Micromonospora chersina]|uniref:hypothetical protein n=1 Tax=Micromonospora chersina TaxID=47854 RepID=UPI00371AAFC8
MGWNAGGFGIMSFPDAGALQAWQAAVVSHADWDDWIQELRFGLTETFCVRDRLAFFAEMHDPRSYNMYLIAIDGNHVELVFDAGEDGFREDAGDIAALLRSASRYGAVGRFYFLGTAGAEGDFVYQLDLDDRASTLTELSDPMDIDAVYGGHEYQAFFARLLDMLEAGNPAISR